MTHPLTIISQKNERFITKIRQLVRRTESHISQSIVRYQDTLDEIEEFSGMEINDSLTYCAGEKTTSLKHWRDSLKVPDLCWSENEARSCCGEIADACEFIITAWESLSKQCRQVPRCSRYADRCLSESEFIKTQLAPDLTDCNKSIQLISKSLEKIGILKFLFCVSRKQIQLKENTFDQIQNDGSCISSIEWVGLDFDKVKTIDLTLEKCRFTRCHLRNTTWNNANLKNVEFDECLGNMKFSASNIDITINKAQCTEIALLGSSGSVNVTNSLISSFNSDKMSFIHLLSLRKTKIDKTFIKNNKGSLTLNDLSTQQTTVRSHIKNKAQVFSIELDHTKAKKITAKKTILESFSTTESSFSSKLEGCEVQSMQLIKANSSFVFDECVINSLEGSKSKAYIEANQGTIKHLRWSESNAWITSTGGDNIKKNTSLLSGSIEHHQTNKKTQCLIIFDKKHSTPPLQKENLSDLGRIGRIAKQLNLPLYAESASQGGSLLRFYQEEYLWLLKCGISPEKTSIAKVMASRPALNMGKNQLTVRAIMLLFFKKRLNEALAIKPVSTCFALEGMSAGDSRLVLETVHLNTHQNQDKDEKTSCSVEMDSYFCQHMLNLFSTYENLSKGTTPKKQLMHVHVEIRQIISTHLQRKPINPQLLCQVIQGLLKCHRARSSQSRSCSDYLINYLTQLAAWYLSIRLKADKYANQLILDLNKSFNKKSPSSLLIKARKTLNRHCSLIACQHLITSYQKHQLTLANNPQLSDLEKKYINSMSMPEWASFSESSLHHEYITLNLEHVRLLLSQYRPLFMCHHLGRHKYRVMAQLTRLLQDDSQTPLQKAVLLHNTIKHLLGDRRQQSASSMLETLRRFAWLALGRSRPTKGYVTTLSLSKEILHQSLHEDSFHSAGIKSRQTAVSYFHGSMDTVSQIRELVGFKARNTLKRQLMFILNKIREHHREKLLTLKITSSHCINLDEQISIARLLTSDIDNIKTWKEDILRKVLHLWYCYESRENPSLQNIEYVSLSSGECVKHFSSIRKDKQGAYSGSTKEHIELVEMAKQVAREKTMEETMVDTLQGIMSTQISRGHQHLFADRAKKALQREVSSLGGLSKSIKLR